MVDDPLPVESRRPSDTRRCRRDRGVVGSVELLYLLLFVLLATTFLGYLGRLSSAGIDVTNAAQDAARAASLEPDESSGRTAAQAALSRSGLPGACGGTATVSLATSPAGTWQGAVVTVEVSCTVPNSSLTGLWTPGLRTLVATDAQVVERFQS